MAGDDKENEIAIGMEVTPTGFNAKVRSRVASALDRFLGSKVDRKSVPIEAENAETAAIAAGRVKMIEKAMELGVKRLEEDPILVERALENLLPALLRKQTNKDAVVELALEDLKTNPPADAEEATAPSELEDAFLNRFERYAEEATSEQIREKWGKVLAAEIRKPNTFSGKVLRVVDELELDVARLFQELCAHHINGVWPKSVMRELTFVEESSLVGAGLIIEPGFGQYRQGREVSDSSGTKMWFWGFNDTAVAIVQGDEKLKSDGAVRILKVTDNEPGLPVYVLSPEGKAIAEMVVNSDWSVIQGMARQLAEFFPNSVVRLYRMTSQNGWTAVEKIGPTSASANN